ncbi:MAG: 3-hydroxyanthranilate 3,4-dioxygenase [Gammaproteobacteria bacterium]|nr:3-hydroxyanthranilate 3,4-dioxygenase [Gammaproteobacteria bacterium]
MFDKALNLQQWIDEHRHLLKPPVCNKKVFEQDDFIVMVVGGPNSRKDYHVEHGPEFFHQLEGEMVLRTIQAGKRVDVTIKAGEIFYLPPHIPHSPQRLGEGIGLVVERKRLEHELDGLQWYCESCDQLLYEEFFPLKNIETDFGAVFERFFGSAEHRTCKLCGAVMEAPEKK